MKPEDDPNPIPLLSAYLDDELEPDARASVESAIEADPRLARAFRELAATRDAVAALPRPPIPRDLAPSVLAAIEARAVPIAREPHLFRYLESRRLGRIAVWATAAALVMATGVVTLGPPGHRNIQVADGRGPALPDPAQAPAAAGPEAPGDAVALDAPPAPTPAAEGTDPRGQAAPKSREEIPLPLAEVERARNAEELENLLNTPDVRLILVKADELEIARDRIEGLLRDPVDVTARALITLHQGIVIDPRHPDRAYVFTLVGDKAGMGRFRERLAQAFPSGTVSEEGPADPNVVLALGESQQIQPLDAPSPLELFQRGEAPDPSRIALQGKPHEPSSFIVKDIPRDGFRGDGLIYGVGVEEQAKDEGERAEMPAPKHQSPVPPTRPSRPREQTILVWVTTRPGEGGRID